MYDIKTKLKANSFIWERILPYRHWIRHPLKPFYWRIPMILNDGVVSVELHATGVGFFATLTQVLYLLVYCEKHNYIPHIRLTGLNYINPNMGPDWFDYYFENRALHSIDKKRQKPRWTCYVRNLDELGIGYLLPTFIDLGTTLHQANDVFFKYVQIKSDINQIVDNFCQNYFRDRCVLGVHYRGTDKTSEASPVSWHSCLQTLSGYLVAHPEVSAIFVASDERGFVEQVRAAFSHLKVLAHDDEYRSDNGEAVHSLSFKGDNYKKGIEAIVNSLLLSKCSALIRTTSALSAWASIFNPGLPVILLNLPFDQAHWFPESEILKVALVCPAAAHAKQI
jgi:hypothetical protein